MSRVLGTVRIGRCSPRVSINMAHGCDGVIGEVALFMKRVGEPDEFAVYAPLELTGTLMLFQFDDLLFDRAEGRYEGRLSIAGIDRGVFQFEYRETVIASVENR